MGVIGIDASGKRVAVVHMSTRAKIVDVLYFETVNKDEPMADHARRFDTISDYLLLQSIRESITGIFVEDAYMGVSRRGSVNHAKVVGSVLAACATFAHDRPASEMPVYPETIMPATWRSRCGIKGRGKEPVWDWATSMFPASRIKNQDIADAACIAYAGIAIQQERHLDSIRKAGL